MTAECSVTDWARLTTQEFDRARIAVLPVAAVEQHGPHLPVGVDTYIAEAYLERVRALLPEDTGIVFLPVQAVGASDEHRAFAGTLTLSPETALRAFIEIGESVHRAGIARLVIINSHGGNIALIDLAARQLRVRHDMLVVHASWGRFGYPEGLFSETEHTHGIHGGDIETSIMLAAYPQLVRREKIANFIPATCAMEREFTYLRADFPAGFGWMTQDLNASGAVGDASLATAEKGEAALDHGAHAFVDLLRDVERFELPK
ncbi:MAG: creatininase family protein [Alphaproteobacteria bacterium]|nr:MAG: creatininase family protein [Alphaproteobacteria bacterium]